MARWVLSPIIGDGSPAVVVDEELTTGPYRPKATLYATEWAAVIPEIGTTNWCLVRATAGDMAAADADPDLTVFPNLQFTDVLTLAQRTWLIGKCQALGQPSGWVVAGITFGEALRTIGRWLNNNFEFTWMRGGGTDN